MWWPRDLCRPGEPVFFLHKDATMGWKVTAGFVYEGDFWVAGGERLEDELSAFTAPHFNDVPLHLFVFEIIGTDGYFQPADINQVSFPFGF